MTAEEARQLKQIPEFRLAQEFSALDDKDVGVVLLNMGGPRTNDDVEEFQKRLFHDPILIRFPLSFLLQNIFAWLLVTFRLKAVKARYMLIGGGSPIYRSTEAQHTALQEELNRRGRKLDVTYGFNYSSPYPEEVIRLLKAVKKKYILPLSLYPHYSKATTGSNMHYLKLESKKIYPSLQFLPTPVYYLHDGYIQGFVDRINEQITQDEKLDDFYLIFSAHGLPMYFLNEGDPYPFQISQTVAKVLTRLNRTDRWIISYQSAVGPFEWLKPGTEDVIEALAKDGFKKILIVPIAFVGDHIETTCEINMEYRAFAQKVGIEDYRMSKALETHPGFIQALADATESVVPSHAAEKLLT